MSKSFQITLSIKVCQIDRKSMFETSVTRYFHKLSNLEEMIWKGFLNDCQFGYSTSCQIDKKVSKVLEPLSLRRICQWNWNTAYKDMTSVTSIHHHVLVTSFSNHLLSLSPTSITLTHLWSPTLFLTEVFVWWLF